MPRGVVMAKKDKATPKAEEPAEKKVVDVDKAIEEAPASCTSSVREYLRRLIKDATK